MTSPGLAVAVPLPQRLVGTTPSFTALSTEISEIGPLQSMKGTRYGSEPFFGPPSIIKFVAPAGIVTLFVPSFPRLRIDTLEERFHSIVKFSLLKGFPESALRTWK